MSRRLWVFDVDGLLSKRHLTPENCCPDNLRFADEFLSIIKKAREDGDAIAICTSQSEKNKALVLKFLDILFGTETLTRSDYIPDENMLFDAPVGNKTKELVALHKEHIGLVVPLRATVLVDDYLANCRSASEAGFSAIHLPLCVTNPTELSSRADAFRADPQQYATDSGERLGREFSVLTFTTSLFAAQTSGGAAAATPPRSGRLAGFRKQFSLGPSPAVQEAPEQVARAQSSPPIKASAS